MKQYLSELTASVNRKGVLEVDTFKGCPQGVAAYGKKGCYGLCYAAACAAYRGLDFEGGAVRNIRLNDGQRSLFHVPGIGGSRAVYNLVKSHHLDWFRIGVNGDPSHDWPTAIEVCEWLGGIKTPVIVTKHWVELPGYFLPLLREIGVVFNTSISALDTERERAYRLAQFRRMASAGMVSVLRIVTCRFGTTEAAKRLDAIQADLLNSGPFIDNPLRIPKSDPRVLAGDILVTKRKDIDGEVYISVNDEKVYLGHCDKCPDQCGIYNN